MIELGYRFFHGVGARGAESLTAVLKRVPSQRGLSDSQVTTRVNGVNKIVARAKNESTWQYEVVQKWKAAQVKLTGSVGYEKTASFDASTHLIDLDRRDHHGNRLYRCALCPPEDKPGNKLDKTKHFLAKHVEKTKAAAAAGAGASGGKDQQ